MGSPSEPLRVWGVMAPSGKLLPEDDEGRLYWRKSQAEGYCIKDKGHELCAFDLVPAGEVERLRAERDEARAMLRAACEECGSDDPDLSKLCPLERAVARADALAEARAEGAKEAKAREDECIRAFPAWVQGPGVVGGILHILEVLAVTEQERDAARAEGHAEGMRLRAERDDFYAAAGEAQAERDAARDERDEALAKVKTRERAMLEAEAARDVWKGEARALEDFIERMAVAPDSQVSAFVRSACVAFLAGKGHDLPPGDPLKLSAEARAALREYKEKR